MQLIMDLYTGSGVSKMHSKTVYALYDIIEALLEINYPDEYDKQDAMLQKAVDAVVFKFGRKHIPYELKLTLSQLNKIEFEE